MSAPGQPRSSRRSRALSSVRPSAQERKERVIAVAAQIFQQKGYEATSIQDIADALGILKGSLYYYIDSKEDLLFDIIQQVHTTALGNIEAAERVEGDALTKLRGFILLQVRHIAANVEWAGVFFQDFRSLSPARRELILSEREVYDRFVQGLIATGKEEGVICRDLDPNLTSKALLGTFNWMYQWYRPTGPQPPEVMAQTFADLVLPALACDAATHVPGHRAAVGRLDPAQVARLASAAGGDGHVAT